MRVMYVASEATPFIKSGGLADVMVHYQKKQQKKMLKVLLLFLNIKI